MTKIPKDAQEWIDRLKEEKKAFDKLCETGQCIRKKNHRGKHFDVPHDVYD